MSLYGTQTARQTTRLQNTPKTGLGNSVSHSWGSIGLQGAGPSGSGLIGNGLVGGPGRTGHLSGFAQVMGGGNGQGPIDMRHYSDFPSLSGPRSQPSIINTSSTNWTTAPNSLRQAITPQPGPHNQLPSPNLPIQHHSNQQPRPSSVDSSQNSSDNFPLQRSSANAERATASDDFPPLSVRTNGTVSQNMDLQGTISSPDLLHGRVLPRQLHSSAAQEGSNFLNTSQVPSPATQLARTNPSSRPLIQSGGRKYTDMTDVEKWALPGLMAAFEARRNAEAGGHVEDTIPPSLQHAVFFGQDLTTLGLDLDSSDPLHNSFAPFPSLNGALSQFDFHDRHTVPDFTLPSAYTVTNVPSLTSRLSSFSDETLFAVFYQHPRDILQELAAIELTIREWRWHKVLRQWLQKDSRDTTGVSSLPIVDLASTAPIGAPCVRLTERTERGVYLFFDPLSWRRERREIVLDYEQLENRHAAQAVVASASAITTTATPAMSVQGTTFTGGLISSNIGIGAPLPQQQQQQQQLGQSNSSQLAAA